jgi:Cu-Zn family superoxide dismutase
MKYGVRFSRGFMTPLFAATFAAALSALLFAGPASAADDAQLTARATFRNLEGAVVGTAVLTQTPQGVLIIADLYNLTPGMHGFHVHAVGACDPPYKTAGGHFNPAGRKHGFLSAEGMHAGDLPNISVGSDGRAHVEVLASTVTLNDGQNSLFDADGSSLVIHAAADDYATDPAGTSGDRIACAVITR